jgi:hypothetical protein
MVWWWWCVVVVQLQRALLRFGLTAFRGNQLEVLRATLRRRDTLYIAPTGVGKSLTYQLPAVLPGAGLTLVVSPLLALMNDQLRELAACVVPRLGPVTGAWARLNRRCLFPPRWIGLAWTRPASAPNRAARNPALF